MGPLILAGTTLTAAFGGMLWLGDLFHAVGWFVVLFALASAAYAVAVGWVLHRPPASLQALGVEAAHVREHQHAGARRPRRARAVGGEARAVRGLEREVTVGGGRPGVYVRPWQ
jgi:hypothetical protein